MANILIFCNVLMANKRKFCNVLIATETLLESPSYHSRVKLGLYLAESFVLTSLLA